MTTRAASKVARQVAITPQPISAEQALMLDVLGRPPVMFQRAYVGVTGSINAALWLSYAMSRRMQVPAAANNGAVQQGTEAGTASQRWFGLSAEECEEDTGLTRYQQAGARKELRQLGILEERRGATVQVCINTRQLGQLLHEQSRKDWGTGITNVQLVELPRLIAQPQGSSP
jgi:hypothetical protein